MKNTNVAFRGAAVAASALALVTGLGVAATPPASAITPSSVAHSLAAKKTPKPAILVGHMNAEEVNDFGPVVQQFGVKFIGKWSVQPVKVTIHFSDDLDMADQVFTLNPIGNVIAPTGPGWTAFPVTLAKPGDLAGCGGFTMIVQDGNQTAKSYVSYRQSPTR